jgi:hypothetical protein
MSQLALPPPPESLTAETAFNYSCLLYDNDDFENTKSQAADYFLYAADEGHPESQFRYGCMLANGDGIPLNKDLSAHYFGLASSNGYLDRKSFMISPNCEIFFKDTTTLIEISNCMINFWMDTIKSISIPTSVEILRSHCFSNAQFERVTIPADSRLREIEESAFSGCTSLISIFIPSSVQCLGNNCFEECISLEIVTFGAFSRLKIIGENAFAGCESLKSICIPAACEIIGFEAFGAVPNIWKGIRSCKSLQSVLFESGSRLTTIGQRVFAGCPALKCIDLPAGVTVLEFDCFAGLAVDGVYVVNDSLVSVTWESGSQLRNIKAFAFAGCVSLVSICIPASVEILENDCFGGVFAEEDKTHFFAIHDHNRDFRFCMALQTVIFEQPSKIKEIGARAFTGCMSLRSFCIPASVEVVGDNCFGLTVCNQFY